MKKIYFEIEDDVVVKYTPMPEAGENIYKTDVVMTKEIFQECYKKWVDPQESEGKSCSNCKYWLLDKNNENRRCKYCFEMDEWVAESEE